MSTGLKVAAGVAVVIVAVGAAGYAYVHHRVDKTIADLHAKGIEIQYDTLTLRPNGWGALNHVVADVAGNQVTADQLSFPLTGGESWQLNGIVMTQDGLVIPVDSVAYDGTTLTESSTSGDMTLKVAGIHLPISEMSGEDVAALNEVFGEKGLVADLDMAAHYDQTSMNFTYTLGSDLFKVDLSGALGGVDFVALSRKYEDAAQVDEGAMMDLMGMEIGSFGVTLADSGLLDRMAQMQARENGVTKEEIITQWQATLTGVSGELRSGELTSGAAWADELDKLGTSWKGMSLKLNPEQPVPLMSVMMMAQMDPNSLISMLNPTLEAL